VLNKLFKLNKIGKNVRLPKLLLLLEREEEENRRK
jgi:hypothetical protein